MVLFAERTSYTTKNRIWDCESCTTRFCSQRCTKEIHNGMKKDHLLVRAVW